ncbi:hypothetical protein [Pleurocapsa sp. PCC 7319]|uniref:hypothetical protein n=1 Tax=Pleurocapsa sp. PCC 7319 TaxID=118161 RepID=UPI000346AC51|nr:hypothetical protein [Pleurocapsa sp. PCC 7319]
MLKIINKIPYSSLMTYLRQFNFVFRSLVAREPQLKLFYLPYILWDCKKFKSFKQNPSERMISSDTELVIDGFQGSANSFAAFVFQKSQTKYVRIAHHLHSPAQIIEAARKNIPILLVIREPEKAVLSLTSRWPYISIQQGLESYISFYSKLEPYAANCIVSTFEQTTGYFDRVVQRINIRFGTKFDVVDMAQANQWKPPQGERKKLKKQKKQDFKLESNNYLLEKANELYIKFKILAKQD